MTRWRSDIRQGGIAVLLGSVMSLILLAACQRPDIPADDGTGFQGEGNLLLSFSADGEYSQMAVQLFDSWGDKVFEQTQTQNAGEAGFGRFALQVEEGVYTVVAIGHGSPVTPAIKSPQQVTFTAKDDRKLTDTFSFCGTVRVSGDNDDYYPLTMQRVTAAVRFEFTDDDMPQDIVRWRFEYSGGSANYSPLTQQGITKSSQAEMRSAREPLEIHTFPYLSENGMLKMTVTALDAMSNVLHSRTFMAVPVTRGSTTTLRGDFFADGNMVVLRPGITFVVDSEWGRGEVYEF